MVTDIYVKDLENLVAKQQRAIRRLEKEKMKQERAAAAFAEFMLVENDIGDEEALLAGCRRLMSTFRFYSPNNRTWEWTARVSPLIISERNYKALDNAVKRLFGIDLKSLKSYGCEIIPKNASNAQ